VPILDRPGARIHYSTAGTGPAVLLVQGVGVIGQGWRPQVSALQRSFMTISIDNRGIGHSTVDGGAISIEQMADDVLAVADAEGVDRFHLVGHSMGGIIAQHVALAARPRVVSLSLLCTFHKGSQGAAMSAGLLWTAIRSRIGTRRMRRHAFVEMVMPPQYLSTVDRDALCEELAVLFGRDLAQQPAILMKQLRAMARFDASASLATLSGVPTLVLSAEHDRIARPEYGRALAGAIPGAQYIEYKNAGHAVTIQCADAVNEILLAHLARVTGVTSEQRRTV
jgi:pimeloyl-ACP methyl ester carboxylesterase